jgi:hypothetical protein
MRGSDCGSRRRVGGAARDMAAYPYALHSEAATTNENHATHFRQVVRAPAI